jgi:hypothetical protein
MDRRATLAVSFVDSAAALPPEAAERMAWDGPAPRVG